MGFHRIFPSLRKSAAYLPSAAVLLTFGATLALSGCGAAGFSSASHAPMAGVSIHGSVFGGEQPVSGSQIQLYAVDVNGNQTALIANPPVTAANGSWSLDVVPGTATPLYTCPSPTTPVFLTATGGNPGLTTPGTNNTSLLLAAGLGDCGNLQPTTNVTINEVTTVAFANRFYLLSEVFSQTALEGAFAGMQAFANSSTGASPGTGFTSTDNGGVVPVAAINTLADAVAACVDTNGDASTASTPCGMLFANSLDGNYNPPTNTLAALENLANPNISSSQPAASNHQIFLLAATNGPFQPMLSATPSSWFLRFSTLNGYLVANPAMGTTGNTIMVTGTNFTISNAVCPISPPLEVTVGATQAQGSFTTTSLTVTVPAGAAPGAGLGQLITASGTCTFPFTVQ